jgi:hypothetical protein
MSKPPSQNEFGFADEEHDNTVACWCCGKSCYAQQLADSEVICCQHCWAKVPHHHRVWIQFLSRAAEEGGLGLRELIARSTAEGFDQSGAADWFRSLYGGQGGSN